MRTWLGGAVIAIALASAVSAETLKLGNEGTYPPFSILAPSGELTGIEPDLAREMCKRMGATCEIAAMDYKALIPSLLQGKLDVVVSQSAPTPERKERMLFTRVIVKNLFTFVAPADSHWTYTKDGLKGLKIGSQRGGATGKYVQDHFADSSTVLLYDNPDQIRLELLAHRIDMAFGPNINWRLELLEKPEGKDWKLDGGEYWLGDQSLPEDERGSGWMVRKGEDALLTRVNAALDAIVADCTYTRIRERYIRFPVMPAEAPCVKPAG